MDFGKYKYEAAVKAREARKNQTNTVLKEIRFRLKIDTHDYETKRGHAMRFLGAGDKVKAMIQFRGREQQRPEMGMKLLNKFAEDVAEVGVVESTPRIDGRNMVMVIGPLKNKAEAKAEARRATQRADAKAANEAAKNGEAPARVDTSSDKAPMTQSLADLLPDGLRLGSSAAAADKARAEQEQAEKEQAAKRARAAAAEKAAAEARRVAAASRPAPAAAPAASAEKPAAAAKPAAAPKPAAVPKPSAAMPAAPKPAARPKPAAAPKPAGKPSSPRSTTGQNKPGTAE